MKNILKYALILAIASTGVAFAQNNAPAAKSQAAASAEKVNVNVKIKNGVISVKAIVPQASKLDSEEDVLKSALAAILTEVGERTHYAKAIESVFDSIKSSLSDPNAPASGPMKFDIVVAPNVDTGVVETKLDLAFGKEKFSVTAKSVFADNGSVSTTGNVQKTDVSGKTTSAPVAVSIDSKGTMTNGDQVSQTTAAQAVQNVVNAGTVSNDVGGGEDSATLIPDNTIVTTATK